MVTATVVTRTCTICRKEIKNSVANEYCFNCWSRMSHAARLHAVAKANLDDTLDQIRFWAIDMPAEQVVQTQETIYKLLTAG